MARPAIPLLALVVAVSAGSAVAEEPPPLRVLAAASLTEVVEGLARRYDGAKLAPSFGASSALARQIRDGAPADVFLSASPDWMDFLRDAGGLAGEPIVLARNRLVCIAPAGGALAASPGRASARRAARSPESPEALLAALGPDDGVAIADAGVPAGEYARAALRHTGVLGALRRRLVGQRDVRAVLHAVEQGELAAGFVYATDARQAAVDVLFVFDPTSHPGIEYQAAVVRSAPSPAEARRFVDQLRGETARRLLTGAGFALP